MRTKVPWGILRGGSSDPEKYWSTLAESVYGATSTTRDLNTMSVSRLEQQQQSRLCGVLCCGCRKSAEAKTGSFRFSPSRSRLVTFLFCLCWTFTLLVCAVLFLGPIPMSCFHDDAPRQLLPDSTKGKNGSWSTFQTHFAKFRCKRYVCSKLKRDIRSAAQNRWTRCEFFFFFSTSFFYNCWRF